MTPEHRQSIWKLLEPVALELVDRMPDHLPETVNAVKAEWFYPPVRTDFRIATFRLIDLIKALYAPNAPYIRYFTAVEFWRQCHQDIRKGVTRVKIYRHIRSILPEFPAYEDVSLARNISQLSRVIEVLSWHCGKLEISSNVVKINKDKDCIGYHHRGIELGEGDYFMQPDRTCFNYKGNNQEYLPYSVYGSSQLSVTHRFLTDCFSYMRDEITMLCSIVAASKLDSAFCAVFRNYTHPDKQKQLTPEQLRAYIVQQTIAGL